MELLHDWKKLFYLVVKVSFIEIKYKEEQIQGTVTQKWLHFMKATRIHCFTLTAQIHFGKSCGLLLNKCSFTPEFRLQNLYVYPDFFEEHVFSPTL